MLFKTLESYNKTFAFFNVSQLLFICSENQKCDRICNPLTFYENNNVS